MGTEWGRVESDGDGVGTGMTARGRVRNGEKLMVMVKKIFTVSFSNGKSE